MAAQDGIKTTVKNRTRRQKRSQAASLVLMGATPLIVLGMDPLHIDVRVFSDLDSCNTAPGLTPDYCEALNREAASRHAAMAPKYTSMEQCETDFTHITNDNACKEGWCNAENFSTCESSENGLFQPPYSSFLVDQSVIDEAQGGQQANPAALSDQQLQPVYGISDYTLQNDQDSGSDYSHHSHIPFYWHYVTANGQYLGNKNLRGPVTMARTQLASNSGQVYSGTSKRGGFGSTARRTMQSARS